MTTASTPADDLKIIREISGSYLNYNAITTENLNKTLDFFNKIADTNSDYQKVIRAYLPASDADNYINKINAIDKSKRYYEIFKELVPLVNQLQQDLFLEFKTKHNNAHLEQNKLFGKDYIEMNKTPLGEDNPIMILEDKTKTYNYLLDEINNTNAPSNNDIYDGLYINNLRETYNIVTSNSYVNKINKINDHLNETLFSYS
jgi:hypothetical protein